MIGGVICAVCWLLVIGWVLRHVWLTVFEDRKGMTEADARVALYSQARKHRISR